MISILKAELLKTRKSLLWPVVVAAPAGLGALSGLAMLSANGTPDWNTLFNNFALPLWCLFLLPISAVAFTALNAQIDHAAGAFEHLLALSVSRWKIFLGKIILCGIGLFLMALLMPLCIWFGAQLGALVASKQIPEDFNLGAIARICFLTTCAALPLTMLQIWVALRFRAFIIPIGLGIVGVLVTLAIAITGTDQADWFPHAQPFLTLMRPDEAMVRALFGSAVSVIMVLCALAHLSHRDVD